MCIIKQGKQKPSVKKVLIAGETFDLKNPTPLKEAKE